MEYSITEQGQKVVPLIISIREFGLDIMKEFGIDYKNMRENPE